MKKLRLLLFPLLLLTVLLCSADAEEPDWAAVRKNQAWYYAADGSVVAGKLDTIVKAWLKGEGKTDPSVKLTVNLCVDKTLKISKIKRGDVSRFKFKVDKKALPKAKKKIVQVSEDKPGSSSAGLIAGDENAKVTVYLWLEDPETDDTSDAPGDTSDILTPGSDEDADSEPLTDSGNNNRPAPSGPSFGGGGGGRNSHAKEKYQSEIGYDQVGFSALNQGTDSAMSTLVLSGEEQELSLTRNGQPADFVPALIGWQDPEIASSGDSVAVNTLLLKMSESPDNAEYHWLFSGELLRKLLRSGISYLALDADDQVILMPTEGFLGGTEYDALKMRGTAGSLFDYEVILSRGKPARITVTVGGETTDLTGDPKAAIHWTDHLRFMAGSDLNAPDASDQENT